jgi:LPXTG-motif cell wall-anchored protein
LGTEDAFELNEAMLERQKEAVQQIDNAALITLGIGLALLAAVFLKKRSEAER